MIAFKAFQQVDVYILIETYLEKSSGKWKKKFPSHSFLFGML